MNLDLAFDDVLIEPTYSSIRSRNDVNTDITIGNAVLKIPIISSPMDTVTESRMAIELGKLGGMGVMHRFATPEQRLEMVREVVSYNKYFAPVPIAFAVGVTDEERKILEMILDNYGNAIKSKATICIDVANGYTEMMKDMISFVRNLCPTLSIMAGNVATAGGYKLLSDLGANSVRIGIGGGSICQTRIKSGCGKASLQSVLDCAKVKYTENLSAAIIADGGVRYPADLCKSLIAGADAIIAGSIFAGTDEAPGDVIDINGKRLKKYRGMASAEVQIEKRGGLKKGTVEEGVSTLIPYVGSLQTVVEDYHGGLKSSMTYVNARNLEEYIWRPELFNRVTENGLLESHAPGTRK